MSESEDNAYEQELSFDEENSSEEELSEDNKDILSDAINKSHTCKANEVNKQGINLSTKVCNSIASQVELHDGLMSMRMAQQEMLMHANKLPQPLTYQCFKKKIGDSFKSRVNGVKRCLEETMDNCFELQRKLMEIDKIGTTSKRQKLNDVGVDEELISDEEIDENMDGDNDEDDDDDDDDEEEDDHDDEEDDDDDEEEDQSEDEEITKAGIVKDTKKNSCQNTEELINERHETLKGYRIKLLKELSEKAKFAPTSNMQGDFKSLSIPINKQINQILEKQEALLDRTQTKRLVYKVIGKDVDQLTKDAEGDSKLDVAKDVEIFDDYDFYCRLMTDLTNRKIASTRDMVEISRRWAELNRLKNKSVKKFLVDQKASKGRKTRYNIIKRLIGLPDIELATPVDNKECDAIFNQIFRQNENESGQSWLFMPVV